MGFRKHLTAKIVAVAASLASLLGVWTLVRANPPPPTDAATAPTPAAASPTPKRTSQSTRQAAPAPVTRSTHTRTRAS